MSTTRRTILIAGMAAAAALAAAPVAQAKTTLRLGHGLAKGHPVDVSLELFAKLVSERSKGDIEIKVFPAGQLGQQRELLEQLQAGALDFAHANASPLAAFEAARRVAAPA